MRRFNRETCDMAWYAWEICMIWQRYPLSSRQKLLRSCPFPSQPIRDAIPSLRPCDKSSLLLLYMIDAVHIIYNACPNMPLKHKTPKTPPRSVYLFLLCLYENGFLVLYIHQILFQDKSHSRTYAANSPSLCPTISSVIVMSVQVLPLCTWNFSPTKFGNIVADLACVLIGTIFWPGTIRVIGSLQWLRVSTCLEMGDELLRDNIWTCRKELADFLEHAQRPTLPD